ncbi:uncharacterized protein LOC122048545 [Zingiber officinale]|uniref:DUF4408 domain-containing protein n=1 Tax=Zingiber officinale TaxID=94328 RepID=A0A8J5HQX7_ZINOF|nr:uncharacterized protein LOC122048545 [Zingiber officinale]KAG6525249.1 hypothetical protein ZIOFF_015203 [Zingiber officinale]
MEKLARSQVAKGLLLLILVLVIPFLSSSLRRFYLYILLNILIVVLCVEAGFLKAISRHHEEKISYGNATGAPMAGEAIAKLAKKSPVLKASKVAPRAQSLKRCSSRPSLFFIGGFEGSEKRVHATKQEEKVEVEIRDIISKQELFTKAEAFIGNFYEQLKMQREESWKKIHELYHKTF